MAEDCLWYMDEWGNNLIICYCHVSLWKENMITFFLKKITLRIISLCIETNKHTIIFFSMKTPRCWLGTLILQGVINCCREFYLLLKICSTSSMTLLKQWQNSNSRLCLLTEILFFMPFIQKRKLGTLIAP